jgi:nucleotide-binding universal stress UspA family protein
MSNKSPFNSLLVPTDFSEASQDAFQWALNAVDGNDSVIIVLHVLDEALIEMVAAHEFGERDEVAKRMRKHAVIDSPNSRPPGVSVLRLTSSSPKDCHSWRLLARRKTLQSTPS